MQNIELAKRRRRNSSDRNRMNAASGYYRQDDMNVQSYEMNNGPRNQPFMECSQSMPTSVASSLKSVSVTLRGLKCSQTLPTSVASSLQSVSVT